MKIGLACGGTGGHIYPGLATAEVLKTRGHDVTLWLAGKDVESEAVSGWEGPKHTVTAEGFQYGISLRSLKTVWSLFRAYISCRSLMKSDDPDVVLAMGSYASVGPVRAAIASQVPVVLHEANVIPGRAISMLSKQATQVAACFEETRHYLRGVDLTVTGFPLRSGIIKMATEHHAEEEAVQERFTILIMGGSRGSKALNMLSAAAVLGLRDYQQNVRVIHLTGQGHIDEVRSYYDEHNLDVDVRAFEHDMASLYRDSDLAICRAGAATCAELMAFGVPALLVPYPHAARNHQSLNAEAMERMGVADMVEEVDLESTWLSEYLDGCINTPARLERMRTASSQKVMLEAAENLADLVEQVAGVPPQ